MAKIQDLRVDKTGTPRILKEGEIRWLKNNKVVYISELDSTIEVLCKDDTVDRRVPVGNVDGFVGNETYLINKPNTLMVYLMLGEDIIKSKENL